MTSQLNITFARQARDKGIAQAEASAERVSSGWNERAFGHFKTFIVMQTKPFKIEDFREWVKDLIEPPPSLRAYGAVTMRAVKLGLITSIGYTKVINIRAHRTPVSLWKKV